jgi:hypothetical protein
MSEIEKEFDADAAVAAEAAISIASGEVVEAEHPDGIEMQEWVFVNDKTNPAPRQIFHMFHDGAFKNKLGIMHAKLKDSDVVHTVIVGIEVNEEGVFCFPIAKILSSEEQGAYMAPDGAGGWVNV